MSEAEQLVTPIEKQWLDYKKKVFCKTDDCEFTDECRDIFYAGALGMYDIYSSSNQLEHEQLKTLIKTVNEEIQIYVAQFQQKRAKQH